MRASAHEMLAKIALARHDTDAAREEAGLAREADPTLPLPIYIDARLLYDQGKYEEALPLFHQAVAELKDRRRCQITELHFYAGDTLARLERYSEAERSGPRPACHRPATAGSPSTASSSGPLLGRPAPAARGPPSGRRRSRR